MLRKQLIAPFRRFAEKHFLNEPLTGKRLDAYLANGWYRMGTTIFTTHFLSYNNVIYSVIWIRLPLHGYSFRKSLRKIIRQVESEFEVTVQPGIIDLERELLFKSYKKEFDGYLSPSIESYLLDEGKLGMYDTWEVTIRKEGQLCGLSYFDVGEDSIESIIGMYDPAYKGYSLGLYTMLREIQHGLDNGFAYFYPGYIAPGNSRFSYKKRIGKPSEVEFFSLGDFSWNTLDQFQPQDGPLEMIHTRLTDLQQQLLKQGISCKMAFNPIFEVNLIPHIHRDSAEEYLDFPLIMMIPSADDTRTYEIVTYDPRSHTYKLLKCKVSLMLMMQFNDYLQQHFDSDSFLQVPLTVMAVLHESAHRQSMSAFIQDRYA